MSLKEKDMELLSPEEIKWDARIGEARREGEKAERERIISKILSDLPSITRLKALQYIRELVEALREGKDE